MSKLSWEPRPGASGTFCSPACGARCKRADYDRAIERAAALCAALGPGWTARVWENMGWHYAAAVRGGVRLEVHGYYRTDQYQYSIFLGPHHIGWARTAKEVLRKLISAAEAQERDAAKTLADIRRAVHKATAPAPVSSTGQGTNSGRRTI